jgi:peptide/nickel transport system substrate-binding protein
MGFASIYSAEYADKLLKAGTPDKLNSQPIGTGPFVFSASRRTPWCATANPDYFAGKPAVDPLIFAITPDANVRLQKLRRNECQIALSPKPLDVPKPRKPTLKVEKTPAFMTAFVAINSQHPPLDKPEVRQAINLGLRQGNYLKAVFEDTAEAANGPTQHLELRQGPAGLPAGPEESQGPAGQGRAQGRLQTTIWTRPRAACSTQPASARSCCRRTWRRSAFRPRSA